MANKNVFISYARADGLEFAERLEEFLSTEVEVLPFLDQKGIKPGDEWKKKIDTAIESCVAILLIVSPKSLESGFVTYEWAYALGRDKKVISLIIDTNVSENDLHPKLKDLQWMMFSEREESHWNHLKETLLDILNENHVPDEVKNAVNDLSGSKESDRAEAVRSLELLATPQADAALKNAINHPHPDVRRKAAIAFAKRTNCMNNTAIPGLMEALSVYGKEFGETVELLAKMNNQEAAECLLNALTPNSFTTYNHTTNERIMKWGILQMSDPSIVHVLRKLKNMGDEFRFDAIRKLAEFKDDETLPDLINLITNNIYYNTQLELIKLLSLYSPSQAMVSATYDLLVRSQSNKYDPTGQIFSYALSILESIKSQDIVNCLEDGLKDGVINQSREHVIRSALLRMQGRW